MNALSQIRTMVGIFDVNLVFGQWDTITIAIAKAKPFFELARTIISDVRSIQGVLNTTTFLEGVL